MTVKLAVIYYSSTATNYQLAQWARAAGEEVGAEVRVLKVHELAPREAIDTNPLWKRHATETRDVPEANLSDLEWADAVIFSAPSRYGQMPSQLKQFLDTTGGLWSQGKLANKVVSAMSSGESVHGGQETTILSIYSTVHTWGGIVAAPGLHHPALAAVGNPYGVSVTVSESNSFAPEVEEAVKHQAKRTVLLAKGIQQALKEM